MQRNKYAGNPYNFTSALILNYLVAGFFRLRPKRVGLLESEPELSVNLSYGPLKAVYREFIYIYIYILTPGMEFLTPGIDLYRFIGVSRHL